MQTRTTLRVLVIEDTEDDYDVLLWNLRRLGYDVSSLRVDTSAAMERAIGTQEWDLIISDWSMPEFSAPMALGILRKSGLDLPFIIVSGTIGEEIAVEALRNGAHDFLLKDKLARLGVAIERELREAGVRRERARMQEQLLISDRMASVGILAAGVAHEINNPLAAVVANLELAMSDLEALAPQLGADGTNVIDEVRDARAAAERVRHIVRDLKIFSRNEDDKRGPVDVEKVMESTLRMASNEIKHRARLIKSYAKVPPVHASDARLGQVFLNLVVNAAQALPEGGADRNEIRVTIAPADTRVKVEIADTGPGIAPDVMSRLFTPFVTTKPAGIGTGLGLSICHRIVTEFGGVIAADSRPGEGTCFTVLLPVAAEAGEIATTSEIPNVKRAARRGKVLLVDDEPMIARTVQRVLASEHDLTAVTRGRDALELIRGGARFDVIVCDLMMPEMTGMELYGELRSIAPDQADAIVFLSGGAFTSGSQAFLGRVANQRIEKPFVPARLRALINDRVR